MASCAPFDPKKELFRWGPIPGRFFYVSIFAEVHFRYFHDKYHGENWSETLYLFKDKRMFWINDLAALRQAGLSVFLRYLLPRSSREEIYQEWFGAVADLQKLFARIQTIKLAEITNDELQLLWNDLHKIYKSFWTTGSIPELANYGADPYLTAKLRECALEEKEISSLMEILTAPSRLSFYQQEEIDLSQTRDLADHTRKYFWLRNSYAGSEILTENFFEERRQALSKNLNDLAKNKIESTIADKETAQTKYRLSEEIMEIASSISDGIGWQDERKKYIFQTLHYQDQILAEVARRFGHSMDDLLNTWYHEISAIIRGENLQEILNRRANGFGLLFHKNCAELGSDDTARLWQLYTQVDVKTDTKIFSGIAASKGTGKKITGRARIILDPNKSKQFKEGEILVAPMTSPEYIFVMKKAVAIITDTGGLTSHAAIVSRELGIPCLVGTKIATHILKDGDLVEIDPSGATVTRL